MSDYIFCLSRVYDSQQTFTAITVDPDVHSISVKI